MKSAAAIVIDGVLRKPVGGTPIPEGIALYHGLCAAFNVVLLRDDQKYDEELQNFLDTEQLTTHGDVYSWVWHSADDGYNRFAQVHRLRTRGYALGLVVEPDPAKAAYLLRNGYNVLLFMHAAYARPDWRPDATSGQRPWDELVAEQQHAAQLRAADVRMGSTE